MDLDYTDYTALGKSIGNLVQEKQKAYGDSFSKAPKIMSVLFPKGISSDQMEAALTIVRVIDKLNRISTNKVDLMGENPWGDIAGYALLELMKGHCGGVSGYMPKADLRVGVQLDKPLYCGGVSGYMPKAGDDGTTL